MSMNVEHFCCTVTVNTLYNGDFNMLKIKGRNIGLLKGASQCSILKKTQHMEIIKCAQLCDVY